MALMNGLIGFFILLLGRQFYLVFVAGMFILLGLQTGENLPFVDSQQSLITFSLFLGFVTGVATIKLKRGMAALAGFFGGGALLLWIPQIFAWNTSWFSWTWFAIAGLISAALVLFFLDYFLIVLSVLLGAALLALNLPLAGFAPSSVFLMAALIGTLTQLILLQYGSGYPD